uniref:Ig-like domain-containing protein n=1 Tax=Anabas testudineus TaxID=64144 RepID=A0AAQ6IN40_ANATE
QRWRGVDECGADRNLLSVVIRTQKNSELVQDDLTLTRRVGQTVSFSCERTGQCDGDYVFWYQKKETETFRVILDISRSSGNIDKSYSSHPQKDDFTSVNKGKGWELEIKKVKVDHSASYYCSCWISGSHSEK